MKYLIPLFAVLILTSCVKDKLENDTIVLEGKWTWIHSVKYTYDQANDTVLTSIVPAADYPDTYGYEILQKGKVYTLKNGETLDKYRLVLPTFKSGLCDNLVGGYMYEILLNNKEDMALSGCVKSDTMTVADSSFTHIPLAGNGTSYPRYDHILIKGN